ncbi:aldehyde dehydrogenase family protein [Paenibacillus sp. N1-5-1-14]|uniref:aldehyde dehydrogenase family protein n=1 Tax=Paenibacillus radicibacter TaxID=2972488 RepID=UPI00215971FB|nr:aldehyde dehydrogenase family protein [Paenibacillus radicibacter]MCR8641051.1 aldehyde dehydrogenase family protein [Paenibacillus radicibacter]
MANLEYVGNYINGEWRLPVDREVFNSVNPSTSEVLGAIVLSNSTDVDEAVSAAKQSFRAWRLVPAPKRADYLWLLAERVQERRDELAKLMTLEMGKVISESYGEVDVVIQFCKYMAGEGRRMYGQTVPAGSPDRMIMTVREPVGVVACITPWNFPLSLAAYKMCTALVAGNSIVWKPASDVALCAKLFTEIIDSCDLPAGVINTVFGSGSTVGSQLAEHPDVSVIVFTGSTEVGKKLAKQAGYHLKRIALELGGKNAVIVLADADLDLAAAGIVRSAYATSGQRCTAASRVIVEASVQQALEQRIVALTRKLQIGNGLDADVHVGSLANNSQLATVQRYVKIAQDEGGHILCGGHRLVMEPWQTQGLYYSPTVITDVQRHHRIAQEEVFGPVLAIITAQDYEDAVAINNESVYGLSSSIYTNSLHYANRAARDLESGLVYINNGTSNAEIGLAFGGLKQSGNGHREVAYQAFDVMTEWKTVYTNY